MTGGRTRPTHDVLEIETLVSTTSTVDLTPKLTVEQRAIAVLCHDILSIAEVSQSSTFPSASSASWSVTWPTSTWSLSTGRPTLATVPTWPCWSGCCTGSTPSDPNHVSPAADQPHSNALAAVDTIQVTCWLLAASSAPARPTSPCGTAPAMS